VCFPFYGATGLFLSVWLNSQRCFFLSLFFGTPARGPLVILQLRLPAKPLAFLSSHRNENRHSPATLFTCRLAAPPSVFPVMPRYRHHLHAFSGRLLPSFFFFPAVFLLIGFVVIADCVLGSLPFQRVSVGTAFFFSTFFVLDVKLDEISSSSKLPSTMNFPLGSF